MRWGWISMRTENMSGNRAVGTLLCRIVLMCAVLCRAEAGGMENADGESRPGVLEPRGRVALSTEFALPVVRVVPRVGDSFREGDMLLEFGSAQAKVNLDAVAAAERAALANMRGIEMLAETRQVTDVEVEMARQRYAEAIARRVAAERELTATVLTAPFSGRVAERHINDHEWAARGVPLLTLIDDTMLEVRFVLPEAAFSMVRAGTPMTVRVPAADTVAEAVVSRVGAVFDAASRTFDIWAVLDNSSDRYRAGMVAEVELPGAEPETP